MDVPFKAAACPFKAAVCQMNSGLDKEANLAEAERLVTRAAEQGASLVALPEMFNCLGPLAEVVESAESIPGATSARMSELAARLGITLLAGSICEQSHAAERGYNTSLLFGPDGALLAQYRKMHRFDIDLEDRVTVTESDHILPGEGPTAVDTDHGRLALSICYDLRFAELYRHYADEEAEILLLPAAFTFATGQAHWELLIRARAVENQAYVIASNQCGAHEGNLTTYGHSMIVDPWGVVLADCGEDSGVVVAEIEPARLRSVREQLPALKHRRKIT